MLPHAFPSELDGFPNERSLLTVVKDSISLTARGAYLSWETNFAAPIAALRNGRAFPMVPVCECDKPVPPVQCATV